MKHLKIGATDIFLDDFGNGKGKITISDGYMGAYNYYWGAMGCSLEEFICSINTSYFVDKLCRNIWEFDARLSVRNIRKHIREERSYELPYWKFMEAQKELRQAIRLLEECENADEFVRSCIFLPKKIHVTGLSSYDKEEFESIIDGIFTTEPWHFIAEVETREATWLAALHDKMKAVLKSDQNDSQRQSAGGLREAV